MRARPDTPERFVRAVSRASPSGLYNPWSDRCTLDRGRHPATARRARLVAHLDAPDVALVLVGEAIGYQGGRYSGIPFTSERLLLEGAIPRVAAPTARLTTRARPWSEPSASILWGTLSRLGVAGRTVLWNACAWHPEGARGPLSNRRPTRAELDAGLPYLERLLELYPAATIGAVGRASESAMQALDRPHVQLRHPAYGGATEFARGLREALK